MTENCRKRPAEVSIVLLSVIALLLIVPVGMSVGTFLGRVNDFGVSNTARPHRSHTSASTASRRRERYEPQYT